MWWAVNRATFGTGFQAIFRNYFNSSPFRIILIPPNVYCLHLNMCSVVHTQNNLFFFDFPVDSQNPSFAKQNCNFQLKFGQYSCYPDIQTLSVIIPQNLCHKIFSLSRPIFLSRFPRKQNPHLLSINLIFEVWKILFHHFSPHTISSTTQRRSSALKSIIKQTYHSHISTCVSSMHIFFCQANRKLLT